MALQHLYLYQSSTIPSTVYIQPILLYGSETRALTRALEDRIAAFDNFCLRRILRIPYTAHVTNADARLRAGSPPQLLPLIQTKRFRFFGHVARMSDSQDTFRALHTSTCRLPMDWRRRPGRPRHTCRPPSAQPWTQLSMATCPGQRTMEATRGNGYAPAWGSLVMMMIYRNCK